MDTGGKQWKWLPETFNQRVAGSSPARLTKTQYKDQAGGAAHGIGCVAMKVMKSDETVEFALV